MFNFIFSILAIPVRLLAWLCAVSRLANPLPILRAAWNLGWETSDAIGVITMTAQQEGLRAAGNAAQEMFEKTLDAQILVTLCWMHIQNDRNTESARHWYEYAQEHGIKNKEMLLPIKLYLAGQDNDPGKREILDEILGRNDLPMEFSRGALMDKAALLLKEKQWAQAEAIADRVLSIEDVSNATWVKWVTARQKHNDAAAADWEKQLFKQAGDGYAQLLIAMGWLYIGERHKAMLALRRAEKNVKNIEQFDKDLAELAQSSEYYTLEDKEA